MGPPRFTTQALFLRAWVGPAAASAALVAAVGGVGFVAARLFAAPVSLGPAGLGAVIAAAVPAIASLALPLAASLGAVSLARRWQAEDEWLALQAAGVRLTAFFLPNLLIAAAVGGACYALSHRVEPAARAAAADAVAQELALRPGRITRLGPLTLAALEVKDGTLEGVFFAVDAPDSPRVGGAARGQLSGQSLVLEEGVYQDPGPPALRVSFDRLTLPIPRSERRWELTERSDAALADLVRRMELHGRRADYERAVLAKRSAWPLAAAMIVLAALPLGLRGLGPPAGALLGFWVLVRLCDQASAALGGTLAAWLPSVAALALALGAWWVGSRR